MHDDADTIGAEERRSAVLVVVVLGVDVFNDWSELFSHIGIGFLHFAHDHAKESGGHTFGEFEYGVSDESVGDDDVCGGFEDLSSFDVAVVIAVRGVFEEFTRVFDAFGTFGGFTTDVELCDEGFFNIENEFRVGLGHEAVLPKVVCFGFGVCADIAKDDGPAEGRHDDTDPGSVYAFESSEFHLCGGGESTGVTGRDDNVSAWVCFSPAKFCGFDD